MQTPMALPKPATEKEKYIHLLIRKLVQKMIEISKKEKM